MKHTATAIPMLFVALVAAGCTADAEPVESAPVESGPVQSASVESAPVESAPTTSASPVPAPTAASPDPEATGSAPATVEGVIPESGSPSAAGAVDWSRYDEDLQGVIDDLAADEDCEGLQEQFTAVLESDAAAESGDLLSYIDDRLQEAECP
jgi:hypothetical protein